MNQKPRLKKCKECGTKFKSFSIEHKCCCLDCGIAYGIKEAPKQKMKENRQAKKEFNSTDKTKLKADAQKLVNKYARLRDQYERGYVCCTCGHTTGQMDGGHFLPTSSYSPIRYNTNQIHQQCKRCNQYNGGMRAEYAVFMTQKYGKEYVESLEAFKGVQRRYDVVYYQKLIRVVTKKLKIVETKLKELQ